MHLGDRCFAAASAAIDSLMPHGFVPLADLPGLLEPGVVEDPYEVVLEGALDRRVELQMAKPVEETVEADDHGPLPASLEPPFCLAQPVVEFIESFIPAQCLDNMVQHFVEFGADSRPDCFVYSRGKTGFTGFSGGGFTARIRGCLGCRGSAAAGFVIRAG